MPLHPDHSDGLDDRTRSIRADDIEQLRSVAASRLRRLRSLRKQAGNPTTTSVVDSVFMAIIRSQTNGTLMEFDDEVALTKYFSVAVRRYLVNESRRINAASRPQSSDRAPWTDTDGIPATAVSPTDVIDVHDALDQLAVLDTRAAAIVEMMFFGGFNRSEIATALGATVDQIRGDWDYAKAWLNRRLKGA